MLRYRRPARRARPGTTRRPTSLVAALTPDGLKATATRSGAFDTASFAEYVRDVLCPALRPGQVVALDNLSAHKPAAVRAAIEAAGCTLFFLPPYSPDFAPIELAWAQVKTALRTAAAHTQEALVAAIGRGPPAGPTGPRGAAQAALPRERRSPGRHHPRWFRPAPDHHRPPVGPVPELAGLLPAGR